MIGRTLSDVRWLIRFQKDYPRKKGLQLLVANLLSIYVILLPPGIKGVYQKLHHF